MKLTDNTPVEGAGPFLFQAPELAPGESFHVDLENVEFNGRKRALRKYVPFDEAAITNDANDAAVLSTYNGQYDSKVRANTAKSFDRQGVSSVEVTNISGSATIPADAVTVEVVKEPYGADEAALEGKKQHPVSSIVQGVTGVNPSDLLGGGR